MAQIRKPLSPILRNIIFHTPPIFTKVDGKVNRLQEPVKVEDNDKECSGNREKGGKENRG